MNKKLCASLKPKNWGSVSFTQGEPADKNTTTLLLTPLPPQDQTANIYFQRSYKVETTITTYKGEYSIKTKTYPKTCISHPYEK